MSFEKTSTAGDVPEHREPETDEPSHSDNDPIAEPLSTRDIEQVVVPRGYYSSPDSDRDPGGAAVRASQLDPVDLSSLSSSPPPLVDPTEGAEPLSALDFEQDSSEGGPESDSEPLSLRDVEEDLTPRGEVAPAPPASDEEPLSLRDVEEDLTPRSEPAPAPSEAPPARKRSVPPPLPRRSEHPGLSGPPLTASALPPVDESAAKALVPVMLERLAESDYEAAFAAATTVLRDDPAMTDALQAAQIARVELYRVYGERLGSRERIPKLVVPLEDLRLYPLDAPSALVLSQVDGTRSIEDVIQSGVMPKLDALRILSDLYLRGFVRLES